MKKKLQKWRCITFCGSCCRLEPHERLEAIQALSEEQQRIYFGLVGGDGWCKNYDKAKRACKIYNERPDFCKVSNLSSIYGFNTKDSENIAIKYCREHIRSVYGGRSLVLKRFNKQLSS